MPRFSFKRQVIRFLESYKTERDRRALLRNIMEEEDGGNNSDNEASFDSKELSDNSLEEMLDAAVAKALKETKSVRYLLPRKPYRDGNATKSFEADLQENDAPDGTPPWLTNEEFREKYRMSRDSFRTLVEMIRGHHQFRGYRGKRRQAPVEHQLMVFLFYLGGQANGASNPKIRHMFRIGRGTAELYKRRCNIAIRSLRDLALFWPDEEERLKIATEIHSEYKFLNCIAVADGTLFPLYMKPESDDAADYHGRKYPYSLTVMIVNDNKRRIWYYLAGFPGSAHDNRVYSHTDLFKDPERYFGRHFVTCRHSFHLSRGFCSYPLSSTNPPKAFRMSLGRRVHLFRHWSTRVPPVFETSVSSDTPLYKISLLQADDLLHVGMLL